MQLTREQIPDDLMEFFEPSDGCGECYVCHLVAVFAEVRRVLKPSGTCWLNLGDSYGHGTDVKRERSMTSTKVSEAQHEAQGGRHGGMAKQLVGIPWRVAFALQADGWYLRSDIIWSKPNPMPESVTDRPTKSHEYLFLLTKSARYYFDADAVREESSPASRPQGPNNGARQKIVERHEGIPRERRDGKGLDSVPYMAGRNIRSVWTIATRPYPGAHFAVFPPELPERCIKAGSSERGVCPECGAPWERVVERGPRVQSANGHFGSDKARTAAGTVGSTSALRDGKIATRIDTGWQPTCKHPTDPYTRGFSNPPSPAVVLDPFAGSGTVGLVANRLSRRAILIDLNPEYLRQQMKRNAQTPLGLAG